MEGFRSQSRAYFVAFLGWTAMVYLAIHVGAVPDADLGVMIQLRLPRVLLASAVGAGLAVAGAVLQALFANPLCEPYTLGISSGSALGAVVGASLGLNWLFAGIALPSFLGALLFSGILYLFSMRTRGSNTMLLLSGVMLGLLGSSLVTVWMALSDASGIQGALFWLLGDLSRARLRGAIFVLVGVLALIFSIWLRWRDLDAFLMGEEGAITLGIDVVPVRRRLIMVSSLLVGFCVSAAGMIGFVGLIVPYFARRWVGSLHLYMLPLCALVGAAVLTASDGLARVLIRPYELPVGVVTALVGAPIFIWIMLGRKTA